MKRKIIGILICTLLFASMLSATATNAPKKNVELEADFNPIPTLAPWDLQKSFDVEASSGALGNAGAEFVRSSASGTPYFYTTRWATNLIHQYDIDGVLLKEFSIPTVSGLRDLAYNPGNGYLYGGAAGGTIWGFDPDGETLEVTMTGSFQCRAIAYDDDLDVFYVSNWGDPVWVVDNDTGNVVDQFNLVTTTSTYGFAYDNVCDSGGPYLWVFDQGSGAGTSQYIYQWELGSGFTTVSHDVTLEISGTGGIAGGLFFTTDLYTTNATLGGLLQGTPDMMFCYEICDVCTDTIPPVTTHIFTPAIPDGDNGWYKSCVTIELDATDTGGSGVCTTEYKFDAGTPVTYSGPTWPFSFSECGCTHEIEYRSTDCCANAEGWNGPFTLMIDTDPPFFNSLLTVTINGISVTVDADVDDLCSGVNRVEFYKDGSTTPIFVDNSGPPWTYTFIGSNPPPNTIQAIAYDTAGNSAASPVINPQSQPQQQNSQQNMFPLFFRTLE